MKLKDVPVGTRVFTSAKFTDPEVREVHYIRLEGDATRPNHVRAARVRTIQGVPGGRLTIESGEYHCVDPGETPDSIDVYPLSESIFLDSKLNPKTAPVVTTEDHGFEVYELAGKIVIRKDGKTLEFERDQTALLTMTLLGLKK